jgi:hypothetical protein
MDLTEGSETSAELNLTPGKYPKENIQDTCPPVFKFSNRSKSVMGKELAVEVE